MFSAGVIGCFDEEVESGFSCFATHYFARSVSSMSRCCCTIQAMSFDKNVSPSWEAISWILAVELFPMIYPSLLVMTIPPRFWTAPLSRFIPMMLLACVPPKGFKVLWAMPSRILRLFDLLL